MNPGIYTDLSNESYHSSQGISRSGVMKFKTSPVHYWHEYLSGLKASNDSTPSMIFGTALHELILEPNKFNEKYLIVEKVDRRTKEGKEYWLNVECKIKIENRIALDSETYRELCCIKDSILSHPQAKELIEDAVYESSIFWSDPETQVLCKARPDIMHGHMIVDIKTTEDAHPDSFRYSIRKYGYHVQAAMLLDGMNQAKEKSIDSDIKESCNSFIIIAVEKKPPYAVAVYVLDEAAIEAGRQIYKSALVDYKKCLEKNHWPSYQTQIISI